MTITLVSFGFLNGAPTADVVIDLRRIMKDPGKHDHIRPLAWPDDHVVQAVHSTRNFHEAVAAVHAAADYLGRDGTAVIAVGCKGGRHRAPTVVDTAAAALAAYGTDLVVNHRDTGLDVRRSQDPDCVFCAITRGEAPASVVREWDDAIAFLPRGGGCTPGHTLVVPRVHVRDVTENPAVSALTTARAAELAAEYYPANLITSAGPEATQTVGHLHVHVVPRREGDGLALPWTAPALRLVGEADTR